MNTICEMLTSVIRTVICEINGKKLHVAEDGRVHRFNKKGDLLIIENTADDKGYNRIRCNNRMIRRHRIIAFCFLGLDIDDKKSQVDHINGVKTDNYVTNLRIVTCQQNQHNQTKAKGFWFVKYNNKYRAQITVNRKHINLGYFDTAEEAHQAYLDAKPKYHAIN